MRRMRYFEAGDAMRGWGVLAVVVGHCAAAALTARILLDPDAVALALRTNDIGFEKLFDSRQVGAAILATQLVVFLFFALSAYLLSRPYVAAMFGQARRSPPLGDYVKHRIGRVVPPFWAFVVITILWFGTTGTSLGEMVAMFGFAQVWTAAPFNQHLSQAWTLNVEIGFYVALPILAATAAWAMSRGGRYRGLLAVLPILAVAAFAWTFSATWLPDATQRSQSPIGGLLTFLPGVAIAVVEVRWGERLGRLRWAPVLSVLLCLAGLGLAYKQSSLVAGGSAGERNLVTLAAGSLLAGVVLWQLTGRKTWRGLRMRSMQWVGERSFSIYLVHGLALFELRGVGADQPTVGRQFLLLAMAVLPVSVVFGGILYALVERPSIRLSRNERPLFREGPVTRRSRRAPTVGTTRDEAPPTDRADPRVGAPVTAAGGTGTDGAERRPDGSGSGAATAPAASEDRPGGAERPPTAKRPPSKAETAGRAAVAAVADRPAWKRPWLGGDGARGLGALLVFVSHIATAEMTYRGAGFADMPGRDLYELFGGEVGWRTFFAPARLVNLFFAFSAYLLARPFIAWALGRTKRPAAGKFYVRRVLRIMPAYWVVTLLVLLWLVVLRDDHPARGADVLKTLFLLDGGLRDAGFHHSWTIPIETAWTVRVEVLGYLALPLLAWVWFAAGRRWAIRGLAVTIGLLLATTLAIRLIGNPALSGPGLLQWLFLPGLTVALVEAHEPLRRWVAGRSRSATLWALLASFLLLCGSEPVSARLITHLVENLHLPPLPADATATEIIARGEEVSGPLRWGAVVAIPMQFVGATGMLLSFIALEWQGGRPPLGLDRRIPRWFGERSYSFYLVHFAVLGLLLPKVLPGDDGYVGLVVLGILAFLLSLLLTWILFALVEMPGMRLASRLTGRRPPGPLSVAPSPEVTQAWRGELAQAEARRDAPAATTQGGAPPDR